MLSCSAMMDDDGAQLHRALCSPITMSDRIKFLIEPKKSLRFELATTCFSPTRNGSVDEQSNDDKRGRG